MAAIEKLSDAQVQEVLKSLQGWELQGGVITKLYKFSDFKEALAFVNRVAELAESQDHHPDILIQYSKVRLTLSTHSAQGLTEKDSLLAQAIDSSRKPA